MELTGLQMDYLLRRYCNMCGKFGGKCHGAYLANAEGSIRPTADGLARCTRYVSAALDGWSA